MQRADGPWYKDITADGRVVFVREGGDPLTRVEALKAVGAEDLARRQTAAELTERSVPFLLAFPLLVPTMLGIGFGGLGPSVRGDNLDVILEATWNGAALGGLVGLVLGAAALAMGFVAVQWLRVSDLEAMQAVKAYNLRVANHLGLTPVMLEAGYLNAARGDEE